MPIWIYPQDDNKFLDQLLKAYKKRDGWECTELWQSSYIITEQKDKYPQYLATLDPKGIGGDKCHLWRDGQTWWMMSGDFSINEELLIERVLKVTMKKFLSKIDK